jgi:hypothetical protein
VLTIFERFLKNNVARLAEEVLRTLRDINQSHGKLLTDAKIDLPFASRVPGAIFRVCQAVAVLPHVVANLDELLDQP